MGPSIVVAAWLGMLSLSLSAQSSYGTIVGTVTDATGATVPVTLALGSNPGSGSLTCATGLALVTVNGTVAFGGCGVDRASYGL